MYAQNDPIKRRTLHLGFESFWLLSYQIESFWNLNKSLSYIKLYGFNDCKIKIEINIFELKNNKSDKSFDFM